jgi:hypothetical protein
LLIADWQHPLSLTLSTPLPQMSLMTSAAEEMSFLCYIEGGDNVFRVAILSTKIVDD